MKLAIHQSQYLPWPPYFRKIARADCFVLMDAVQYQKNGVQNRNRIRNRQGEFWLTIPVTGSLNDTIADKRCADAKWSRRHWKSIQAAYGRAPNWPVYRDALEELYHREFETLGQVNADFLGFFLQALGIETPVVLLSSLDVEGRKSDLVLNICRSLGAGTYLSGHGAEAYLDASAFAQAGIRIEYIESRPPLYAQMHGRFIPGLSMLDMMLNASQQQLLEYLRGLE